MRKVGVLVFLHLRPPYPRSMSIRRNEAALPPKYILPSIHLQVDNHYQVQFYVIVHPTKVERYPPILEITVVALLFNHLIKLVRNSSTGVETRMKYLH